jgi:4-amino-4-deoxy-L-arabinose transferase-like glycosyltransferase
MRFIDAVKTSDWANTFQSGHPGIPTMWLSGTALGMFGSAGMNPAGNLQIAQLPIALATSLGIVALYFLVTKIFNFRVAVLGASLLALDPEFIAHSRVIHLDALLATCMILSLASLLAYLNDSEKSRYLIWTGLFAGLALLTKLPAVFLVLFLPIVATAWALCSKPGPGSSGKALKVAVPLLIIAVVIAVTVVGLWPAMWTVPGQTVSRLFATAKAAKSVAHGSGFSMGHVSKGDYGFSYYPVILLMKSTPVTLVLLAVCLMYLVRNLRRNGLSNTNKGILALLFYVALFMLQMSLGAKKGERYLLPVFPAVAILASIGFYDACDSILGKLHLQTMRLRSIATLCLLSAVMLFQASMSLPLHPYYLSYFNPVIGGASQATKILVFGWGEGLDLAAKYLNEKPGAENLSVAAQYIGFETFFKGKTIGMNEAQSADYLVFYGSAVQRDWNKEVWDNYKNRLPEKTVFINKIPYAYIYKKVAINDISKGKQVSASK